MAHIPSRDKDFFASRLKQIWLQPDYQTAMTYAEALMDEYEGQYPVAIQVLEAGLEGSQQFCHFHQIDHRKISSTNMLDRLNRVFVAIYKCSVWQLIYVGPSGHT